MKSSSVILAVLLLGATCASLGVYVQSTQYRHALQEAEVELATLREQSAAAPQPEAAVAAVRPILPPATTPGEGELEGLQVRVLELEEQLQEKDQLVRQLRVQAHQPPPPREEPPRERREPQDWAQRMRERMQKLQEEDPEEYARIQERRHAAHQRITEHLGSRLEFLSRIDPEGLSVEYLDNHNALIEKLARLNEHLVNADIDPASEDAWQVGRSVFREFHDVAGMMDMERDILLNDFAVGLGFSSEDSKSFVEYVEYVNEMTSGRELFHSMRGAMGRPRGGGGR